VRLHWHVGARTDVGLGREGNEDAMYAGPRLLAVADGVGGSVAGEIASSIAIESLAPLDGEASIPDPLNALRQAIVDANDGLRTAIERDPALTGMGTTLTAMLWSDEALGLAQLGDSRAYRLRGDAGLEQITRDQTLVQSLIDEGQITAEQAQSHPQRSWILRALDGRGDSTPDLTMLETEPGDRFLLCSDGLSDYVAAAAITEGLRVSDPQGACDRLVDLALEAGAPDNVTCIVADVTDGGSGISSPIVGGAAAEARRRATDGGAQAAPSSAPRKGGQHGRQRSIGRRLAAVAAVVVILVAAGVAAVAVYVHHQWYIAPAAGKVAVYQGVKGSAAGIDFSHVHATTDIPVSALPQDDRQRVAHGIDASGKSGAATVVTNLRQEACALAAPSPAVSPSPSPHATAGANGKHSQSASPSPSPAWCAAAQ
jgi:protein phosphatase